MKVIRSSFYQALKELARVADTRAHLPILKTVRLEAHDGQLTVAAANLETYVTCCLSADGDLAAICLPAKPLLQIVKTEGKGGAGIVEFENLENNRCAVRVDDISTKLTCLDPNDFPVPPGSDEKLEWSPVATLPSSSFRDALTFVLTAASDDPTRMNINGIFLSGAWAIGTDGHRLHRSPLPASIAAPLLIPTESAEIVYRLTHLTEHTRIECAKGFARFKSDSWQVDTKLIKGNFPDVEHVIPAKEHQLTRLIVDAAAFSKAISRLRRLSKAPRVKVRVNGTITLSTWDDEIGEAEIVVPTLQSNHIGEDLMIAYNPLYLLDALHGADSKVEMSFAGPTDPLRIDLSDDRLAIVMPVRV
jgi:DNA polymerase III sliding clamp (beta) subunit (PCNA family)